MYNRLKKIVKKEKGKIIKKKKCNFQWSFFFITPILTVKYDAVRRASYSNSFAKADEGE